jgi:predicted ATPase/DNA-binding SARP family transcriptional activator
MLRRVTADEGVRLRVEVLGPLRLLVGGAAVDVAGPKRRAVLSLLAFAHGRGVTMEHLIEALWPIDGPDRGRAALHNHISRLRRHLGPAADRLQTSPAGYRLELGPEGLDEAQARALLAAAKASRPYDPARSYALLRQAYGLWRGPVLADLVEFAAIAPAIDSAQRLRREVGDALVDAAVAAGEAAAVVDIAEKSYLDDPLGEPAVILLMRVLASVGRAPEALGAAAEFRRSLADETGLDPSPALGELVRDIAGGVGAPAARPAVGGAGRLTLVGRDSAVAALHRMLTTERLVTVVGPGGVGKTRVALEVARRTEPTTVLLLAPLTDPAAIPHAFAAALDLTAVQGDVLGAALAVLAERSGLLLIDNCEHLVDAVRDLVEVVLAACPQVTVLATSREPLGLPAEYVSRLAPLPLPGKDHDLSRVASVALFLERAARVRPEGAPGQAQLPVVADVVRRLDGMPLAIELAAGRLSTFSVEDLRDRLDRALDLLGRGSGGGVDRRHATLRATVEWSYALLTRDEQRLFRNLSVFVDGVDVETVERVGGQLGLSSDPGSVLARLVDASMVVADLSGRPRYRMLHLLRAFGVDRLVAAGEEDSGVDRLVAWAIELTASIERDLLTEREPAADALLRCELPNLREAWRQARRRGSLEAAAAMIGALHDAVTYRDLVEVGGWADELADDATIETSPRAAVVLGTAAEAAYHRGDYARAEALGQRGLELAVDDGGRWRCLATLCVVDLARQDHDACVARALAAAALGRPVREEFGIAALAHAYRGRLDEARSLNARGLAGAASPSMRSWGAYVAGEIDNFAGAPERAEHHYRRAIDLARESGATFLVGIASLGLLTVRAATGHVHQALAGFREVIDYFARIGNWTHQWVVLRNLAQLLRRIDDSEHAERLDALADKAADGKADATDRAAALDIARQAIEHNQTSRD